MVRGGWFVLFMVCSLGLRANIGWADNGRPVENQVNKYLMEARVAEGVDDLSTALMEDPQNDDLLLGLGFLKFIQAVQNMGQSWYRYGLRSHNEFSQMAPFLRLPVPPNPNPVPISNSQARQIFQNMINDLMVADQALSQIQSDEVQLRVYFGRAFLDFDGDGIGSDLEALWRIYAQLNRRVSITPEQAQDFNIKLDAGDVYWLRGYCHFLTAMLEFWLSYDDSRLFEHTAHLFFERPLTPYSFLLVRPKIPMDFSLFTDAIALIHLMDLPVKDPQRSAAALYHLQQMIHLSRQSWQLYMQETDDDHEWIPNPNQTGVVPGIKITQQMVQEWLSFLDEAESILSGQKLIPFWRGESRMGVNIKRVFTEPRRFDLVLWIQGTAAAPYLEEGELTQAEFWQRLMASFNGRFIGFALWFN